MGTETTVHACVRGVCVKRDSPCGIVILCVCPHTFLLCWCVLGAESCSAQQLSDGDKSAPSTNLYFSTFPLSHRSINQLITAMHLLPSDSCGLHFLVYLQRDYLCFSPWRGPRARRAPVSDIIRHQQWKQLLHGHGQRWQAQSLRVDLCSNTQTLLEIFQILLAFSFGVRDGQGLHSLWVFYWFNCVRLAQSSPVNQAQIVFEPRSLGGSPGVRDRDGIGLEERWTCPVNKCCSFLEIDIWLSGRPWCTTCRWCSHLVQLNEFPY